MIIEFYFIYLLFVLILTEVVFIIMSQIWQFFWQGLFPIASLCLMSVLTNMCRRLVVPRVSEDEDDEKEPTYKIREINGHTKNTEFIYPRTFSMPWNKILQYRQYAMYEGLEIFRNLPGLPPITEHYGTDVHHIIYSYRSSKE